MRSDILAYFESVLNQIQARNGVMITIGSCHDAPDLGVEVKVHIKAPEIKIDWKIYRLRLVVTCNIEAAQYG